jgi:hypothetical protein
VLDAEPKGAVGYLGVERERVVGTKKSVGKGTSERVTVPLKNVDWFQPQLISTLGE